METAVLASAQDRVADEAVAALERSRGLPAGGQHVTEHGCPRTGGRSKGPGFAWSGLQAPRALPKVAASMYLPSPSAPAVASAASAVL